MCKFEGYKKNFEAARNLKHELANVWNMNQNVVAVLWYFAKNALSVRNSKQYGTYAEYLFSIHIN